MSRTYDLPLVLLFAASFAGCEAAFEPFEQSDLAFSLFGYFDVAADTHYVRVSTLRQSLDAEDPVQADVVLEDLETGRQTALRDSVFRFGGGAAVHNFWAAASIRPGAAYRLTATGPDGARAAATFHTPEAFPRPELESGLSPYSSPQFPPTAQSMSIREVEQLADVRITYALDDPQTTVTVSYLDRVHRQGDGSFILAFNAYEDVQRALGGQAGAGAPCPALRSAFVLVAAATAEWPDLPGLDPEVAALPTAFSNVEGGLGYVGGVMTQRGVWPALPTVFDLHRAGCLD